MLIRVIASHIGSSPHREVGTPRMSRGRVRGIVGRQAATTPSPQGLGMTTLATAALTRPFSELSRADIPYAGGKGANLGELTAAGLPVPPGFVVGAPAYAA